MARKQTTTAQGFPTELPFVDPEEDAKRAGDETAERIAALGKQIEVLTAANAAKDAQIASALRPAATVTPQITIPPRPAGVDLSNMPDPAVKPDEYNAELQKRINNLRAAEEAHTRAVSAVQAQATSRYNTLWENFSQQHSAYAEDPEKAELATVRVLNELRARGVDADAFMAATPDAFFKEVTGTYDRLFGKPDADEADEPEAEAATGIFGGGVPASEGKSSPAIPQSSSMFASLKDWQAKSGFHS